MTVFLALFLALLFSTQSVQLAATGSLGLVSVRLFRMAARKF